MARKPQRKGIKLVWNKRERDWFFYYPDREGKTLTGLFFQMLKIEENISWLKYKWDPLRGQVEIPDSEKETLIQMLTERGYDYTTLRITCKKLPEKEEKDTD